MRLPCGRWLGASAQGCHRKCWDRRAVSCPRAGKPERWTVCVRWWLEALSSSPSSLLYRLKAHGYVSSLSTSLPEKLKSAEMRCALWRCSRLRWTWQPDLIRSALTRLLSAVCSNMNYSMILSLMQELICDICCLDSAEIERILYNKLRTLI